MTMSSLHNIPAVLAIVVAGFLVAYAAYRRSAMRTAQKRTSHDLRSELRAELESLRAVLEALPANIGVARRSRTAAAHAAGDPSPEGLQQWLCELDRDLSEVDLLKSQLFAADAADSLSDMDLEVRLVEILALSLRASALAEKYRASISVQETNCESLTDDADAEAVMVEASQYSLNDSRSSIVESAV
jgi:hypothetical protein